MSLRTINDPSGLNIPLVERLIGMTAYDIVKFVAMNMDDIKDVVGATEQVGADKTAVLAALAQTLEAAAEAGKAKLLVQAVNNTYFEDRLNPPPVDAENNDTYWVHQNKRLFLARNVNGVGVETGVEFITEGFLENADGGNIGFDPDQDYTVGTIGAQLLAYGLSIQAAVQEAGAAGAASSAAVDAANAARSRSNHTGTQAISTVAGLADALASRPTSEGLSEGDGADIGVKSSIEAPGLIGQTLRDWYDGFVQPARFGAIEGNLANNRAAFDDLFSFVALDTQASEPFSFANLSSAKIAKRLDMQGKIYRVTDSITVPERKVDRNNSLLHVENGGFIVDGNFTLIKSDQPSHANDISAELLKFTNILFQNKDPNNTAVVFDPAWCRMWLDGCEFMGITCLEDLNHFAQEWKLTNVLARYWPAGRHFFRSQGAYAVVSQGCKFHRGGGYAFYTHATNAGAGVVACASFGDICEGNVGGFWRASSIRNAIIAGLYMEKNSGVALDFTPLGGGYNVGLALHGILSDSAEPNRVNDSFYDIILGPGGAEIAGIFGTNNLIDNSQCRIDEVVHRQLQLYTDYAPGGNDYLLPAHNPGASAPYKNKKFKVDIEAQGVSTPFVPDPLSGYGSKITAVRCVVTPSNGVEAHTVCLPPARKGGPSILVNNSLSSPTTKFTMLPSYSADGSRFFGGVVDQGYVHETGKVLTYVPIENGVYLIT